jgi:hypothetical protein
MSENDPRLYSVNRDIAHNFDEVVRIVAHRLENECWPAIDQYLKKQGLTDDDLGLACKQFIEFVASAAQDPDETIDQAMSRTGYLEMDDRLQVALMAHFGAVMAGMYFHGVREATIRDSQGRELGPTYDKERLVQAGHRARTLMCKPRWARKLIRARDRMRAVLHAVRGQST